MTEPLNLKQLTDEAKNSLTLMRWGALKKPQRKQSKKTSSLLSTKGFKARTWVNGKNQWEWVFQNEQTCFQIICLSCGEDFISEVMDDYRS